MTKCSTSWTGNLVASAIDWKVIRRDDPSLGRAKAVWIKAIRQIFCLKNADDPSRIG
jgi:hypothetical protein